MKVSDCTALPIDGSLSEIISALKEGKGLVLVAEPGAGKTTRLPRAMLEHGFAGKGSIVVLEPRRLAARLAAHRVAAELGERVGERVGYQVRFDSALGPRTRLRFITEGIFIRELGESPLLHDVSAVILDEFHERSLYSDLALAYVRRLQASKRPDLCVVVMSATLNPDPIATFLNGLTIRVPGRTFDVSVEYADAQANDQPLEKRVASAVKRLIASEDHGSILVFLPGAAEIRRAKSACEDIAQRTHVSLETLHGEMTSAEQERVIRASDRRKVILSTNVAETSITIDGVAAVIDSGLARVAWHSPWTGIPTLTTAPISRASATQRAGRAGRTKEGRCIRLYTKHDHDTRPSHDTPEILRADLAELVLFLHASGSHDLDAFPFFESPPKAALHAAEKLLRRLGALKENGDISEMGRRMSVLPMHPRLARLVLSSKDRGVSERGCLIAAILGERDMRRNGRTQFRSTAASTHRETGLSDVLDRLELFESIEHQGLTTERIRNYDLEVNVVISVAKARDQYAKSLGCDRIASRWLEDEEQELLMAILTAFPDRVGRRRKKDEREIVFAEGGSATLSQVSVVADAQFVVGIDVQEHNRGSTIHMASAIEPEWLLELFPDSIQERSELIFNEANERVEAISSLSFEGLVLDESRKRPPQSGEVTTTLRKAVEQTVLARLCNIEELQLFTERVAFAKSCGLAIEPPTEASVRDAFIRACEGRSSFEELRQLSLLDTVKLNMPKEALNQLDYIAPLTTPIAGRKNITIQYENGKTPWIASRMQDFFGMTEGPRIANGKVPLVLHLLAPNQRAVQVTSDLSGFWQRHYPTLRRQLMRRYPRHSWPENPTQASPPQSKGRA